MTNLNQILDILHFQGLAVGLATFLIIGLFHPLVIKGYYYLGLRCRTYFAIAGAAMCILSLLLADAVLSTIAGVTAFSCFWSIKEVTEQKARVEKGWFPENPRRKEKNLRQKA